MKLRRPRLNTELELQSYDRAAQHRSTGYQMHHESGEQNKTLQLLLVGPPLSSVACRLKSLGKLFLSIAEPLVGLDTKHVHVRVYPQQVVDS